MYMCMYISVIFVCLYTFTYTLVVSVISSWHFIDYFVVESDYYYYLYWLEDFIKYFIWKVGQSFSCLVFTVICIDLVNNDFCLKMAVILQGLTITGLLRLIPISVFEGLMIYYLVVYRKIFKGIP